MCVPSFCYVWCLKQNSNLTGGGEQAAEVMNGEVNGPEQKDHTENQQNGVQKDDAGEQIKCNLIFIYNLCCVLGQDTLLS